ncbi:MAG: urease accessory protein UreD, partial [Methyloceanibacter sp.]
MAAAAVGRRLVSGRLELEFAAAPDGRTYLRRQFASYPFHVCRVQFQDRDIPDLATLYVQSCSGGVYEDDRLKLALAAGENAKAHVSTQAATVVHSMPTGRAEQIVRLDCAHGSYLEYLPDPQILFPGSSCRSAISVR